MIKARELVKAGKIGQVVDGARRLQPQQRQRRVAVSDSAGCEPADGELGSVHRTGAEAAVRSEPLLPVALLLGLLGRHRDGSVRPPRLVAALHRRREDAEGHRRDGRELPVPEDARGAGHRERAARCTRRASPPTCRARSTTSTARPGARDPGHEGQPAAARRHADVPARSRRRENNRWVVDSWPEALEKAYYDDPKVQAIESPSTWAARSTAGEETGAPKAATPSYMHVENFFARCGARKQPVEDAVFGHSAAACAHMVNRSIREKRMVEWDFAAEKDNDIRARE